MKNLTLNEIVKRMSMHAESFGRWLVMSFGYDSDFNHTISLRDENKNDVTLSIPMFHGDVESALQADETTEQYMLLSSCERSIDQPELFDDYKQAFDEMIKGVAKRIDFPAERLQEHAENGTFAEIEGFEDNFGIEENAAWVTNGNNHNNYDWKIVAVTIQLNKVTKCED